MAGTNLAAALARNYSDTILVTPNLRGSLVPQMLGLHDGNGVVELLAGTATLNQVARRPADVPRLRVITPGVESALGTADFQFDAVSRLVARLREESRYVIIEAEGGEGSTDAFAFAEFADAAVIVVEASRTVKSEAVSCARRLDQVHTMLLGSVLMAPVEVPPRWRSEPPPKVRPLPDPSDEQLPDLPPRAVRMRPAQPEQRPARRPDSPPAQDAPSAQRPPRELSQTWPFPKPGLPAEEDKPRRHTTGSERPRRAADTGTG
jgi:hypothetical protein